MCGCKINISEEKYFMKKIKAKQNLTVFSHDSGCELLIPLTLIKAKIFATRLEFYNFKKQKLLLSIDLRLKGEVKDFTVLQDLKKGLVQVTGFIKKDFFKYQLFLDNIKKNKPKKTQIGHIGWLWLKAPKTVSEVVFEREKGRKVAALQKLELPFALKETEFCLLPKENFELLSLGSHKKQQMEMLQKRSDLTEILPLWFWLGKMMPGRKNLHKLDLKKIKPVGTLKLLQAIEIAISNQDKQQAEKFLLWLFKTGFQGIFMPCLFDAKHQGILETENNFLSPNCNNISDMQMANVHTDNIQKPNNAHDKKIQTSAMDVSWILSYGAILIRSLFFQEELNLFKILPVSNFFAGRFINIQTQFGLLDIEWSKKLLKKMVLKAEKSGRLQLRLQKPLKSFRLLRQGQRKGKILNQNSFIFIEKSKLYYFDRFQK